MFINETFFYKKLFLTFSNLHLKITGTGHKNVSMSSKILSANLGFELSLIFCMLILILNIFGWVRLKWAWLFWSRGSQIGYISVKKELIE